MKRKNLIKNREDICWIFRLKEEVPQFLGKLRGYKVPGFFQYSLSGDLYNEDIKWGLGNTVFAVKIYFTLGLINGLSEKEKKSIEDFIISFQNDDGTIYDPLVKRKSFFRTKLLAIKNLDFFNFFSQRTIIAETRQAISALNLLGRNPNFLYQKFPKTTEEIDRHLNKLDWSTPWSAGSHFSHLIFFLENSELEYKEDLIDFTIYWVSKLQNYRDGVWYKGNPTLRQKINGAMKVITGLKVAGKMNIKYPEKLIDLCLLAKNDEHACDNFNVIYVLHYASKMAKENYRFDEIRKFSIDRLEIYKNYYFPELGGFSFLPNRSNMYYYGAKITKGLYEPDIHGTVMFLWGISIIAQILGIEKELGFKEQIP
ncbi:MAG: hypothetical protein ACFFDN_13830 [Candidatus Hodarchaeota archaeon]